MTSTTERAPVQPSKEPSSPNNEHGHRKGIKIAAIIGGVSLLAAGGAYLGINASHNGEKTADRPVATDTPNKTSVPSPEKTAAAGFPDKRDNFERTIALPLELVPLKSMSLQDFEAQPKTTQLEYATFLGQYRAAYEAWYYRISGSLKDQPGVVSASSTPDQILQAHNFDLRMAASMSIDDGEKYIAAHYDGNETTNPQLKLQLDERKIQQYTNGGAFSTEKPGDAIPASALAHSNSFNDLTITHTNPTTYTNLEGERVSGTDFNLTHNNGTDYREIFFTKTVSSVGGTPSTEVIVGPVQSVN